MLQLFEYELPFRSAFKTGSSEFNSRKGVILHYRENNFNFVSEASPLPGFSVESFDEVRDALADQKKLVENWLDEKFSIQSIRKLTKIRQLHHPSIQFSLSFLSLSILANRQETTLFELFDKKSPQHIPVNDVIGRASSEEMKNQIKSSIKDGFKVLKIKAPWPLEGLPSLLGFIHNHYPEVQIRLDANQSWPRSELKGILGQLEHLPIEYIEEPCKINNLSEIEEIQKLSGFPIALDESISTIDRLKTALSLYPNLVLIIKPMVLGNILEIHETISQFRSSFKRIVVTTSLESGVGRTMTALTASLIGDPQMRHGLHTGHLLADDLLPDFEIENGSILNLPKNPATEIFSQIKTSYLKKLG